MIAKLAAMLALSALAACQLPTREAYRDNVQTWIGRHSDDLVTAWGPPDRAIDLSDGSRLYEYDRQQQRVVPGPRYAQTVPVWTRDRFGRARLSYVTVWRDGPSSLVQDRCVTRFRVDRDRRVQEAAFAGNACVAYPPEPRAPIPPRDAPVE